MKLLNKSNQKIIAERIETADSFFKRIKGLLGKDVLDEGEGLHIIPCNSIHSFFMKFEFDAVFIDKNKAVKKLCEKIPPWLGVKFCFSAYSVIELPAGTIAKTGIKTGDTLEFVE